RRRPARIARTHTDRYALRSHGPASLLPVGRPLGGAGLRSNRPRERAFREGAPVTILRTASPMGVPASAPSPSVSANALPAQRSPEASPIARGAAHDTIGVAECDAYIATFQACVSKMPASALPSQETAFKMMCESWRATASTQGREA